MKLLATACLLVLLGACSAPHFVGDARPVPVTSTTPDHFEFPARFAVARLVYGRAQTAGPEEAAPWSDLANRSKTLGSFTPLTRKLPNTRYSQTKDLVEAAREQRFNYVLLVRMYPSTGAADVMLLHAGSGGVMATATAVSPSGGQRGFWGGQIRNPARLERATLKIAKAAMPLVEDTLRGATMRQ